MTDIDIVDALRGFAPDYDDPHALMRDAADEIERLRGEVEWEYGENVGYKRKNIVPRDVACITWGTVYRRRKAGAGPWVPVEDQEPGDEC